jgi:inhibitor of cysteine peptidase
MSEVLLGQSHSGGSVVASAGDIIVLRLAENPTTGYRWHIDAALGLEPRGDEFAAMSSAPGGAGERVLRFAAPTRGTTHIDATLRRPWETGAPPQARFAVLIEVR